MLKHRACVSAGAVPSRCVKLYSNKIVNFSVLARADTGPMLDKKGRPVSRIWSGTNLMTPLSLFWHPKPIWNCEIKLFVLNTTWQQATLALYQPVITDVWMFDLINGGEGSYQDPIGLNMVGIENGLHSTYFILWSPIDPLPLP